MSWEDIIRKGYKGQFYLGRYDGENYQIEGQNIPEGTLLNELRNFNKPQNEKYYSHWGYKAGEITLKMLDSNSSVYGAFLKFLRDRNTYLRH